MEPCNNYYIKVKYFFLF
uniref:Uncharacterized protein n=1 Tax=Anguilla anguilla TaxID=7936 RepID=A0A0E9S467_ANGAN